MIDLISNARNCIGVKFRHQGRTKQGGMDCAGLIAFCLSQENIKFNDVQHYARNSGSINLENYFNLYFSKTDKISENCIVTLEWQIKKVPCHCGIIASDKHGFTLIHAYARARSVVEQPLDDFWINKISSIYRI